MRIALIFASLLLHLAALGRADGDDHHDGVGDRIESAPVKLREVSRRLQHPQRNRWAVIIDCWKAAASGTGMGTSSPITVKFFNKSGRLLGSTTRWNGANKCWDRSTRWSIRTRGRVSVIKIQIKGKNAYLIDKVLIRKNGHLVARKNKDYCLSKDKDDHLGRWEAYVNKCRKRLPLEVQTQVPTTSPTTPPTTSPMSWIQVGNDVDGLNADDELGGVVSFSDDGERFAVTADKLHVGTSSGVVRVYEEQEGIWIQIGSDIIGDGPLDNFGDSVAMSGDGQTVAIGANSYRDAVKGVSTGQTKIFQYLAGSWVLLGTPIIGEASFGLSGWSVSLSYDGNIAAIGAIGNGGNGIDSGHVRVYEFSLGDWIQLGADIDGEAAEDSSGDAVSLSYDGLTVAIGAPWNDDNGSNSGHTRIYEYESGTWIQRGQDLDGEARGDSFGGSVSLSADGNTVAVGARFNDGENAGYSGHVRIFEYNLMTATWSQLGSDIDGEARADLFGSSVSLSSDGTAVAVGASWNDGNGYNSGHVQIYRFDGEVWEQVGGDIEGESKLDRSGESVSLSGDGNRVLIGAPGVDDNGSNSGHARVYELRGGR